MHILLLGSGGREHALAWKMKQSPLCTELFIATGNGGTAACGQNVNLNETDFEKLYAFVKSENIDMIVCGPEAPLVAGAYDFFTEKNVPFIGPSKAAAQLEGSKAFSKKFMKRHGIPTAAYFEADAANIEAAMTHLEKTNAPYVLKADGLAAGKGVLIIESLEGAKHELRLMIDENKFGEAGKTVVIEEFLDGIEFSVFVLTDGRSYKILPNAKDYKRIGEGDKGLNTGGMGAISPVPFVTDQVMREVETRIIQPTISGLQKEQLTYKGFIYFGLIKTGRGIDVIEYNCRMGDPETEVVMPRIESDLVTLFKAVHDETLASCELKISAQHAATVVLASAGYPGDYAKGKEMQLPEKAEALLFHAGTKESGNKILTNGGRVMAVTSLGNTLSEALEKANAAANQVAFDGKYFRRDIGYEFK